MCESGANHLFSVIIIYGSNNSNTVLQEGEVGEVLLPLVNLPPSWGLDVRLVRVDTLQTEKSQHPSEDLWRVLLESADTLVEAACWPDALFNGRPGSYTDGHDLHFLLVGVGIVGGSVLKRALLSARSSQKPRDVRLWQSIRKVCYLGSPHDELRPELPKAIRSCIKNEYLDDKMGRLASSLKNPTRDHTLFDLSRTYRQANITFDTLSVYEEIPTSRATASMALFSKQKSRIVSSA